MDIPHGMREVVEQECNASQVGMRPWQSEQWRQPCTLTQYCSQQCCQHTGPNMSPCGRACVCCHDCDTVWV
jgi:hypothetical protein